ncbi:MAG: tRNA (adenosine(37)-N6)-threonylcarbamoyltransferase complex dimerization subunit type 1 TsaB [Succinivibrio sp.]
MKLLSIETSTENCSVALSDGDRVFFLSEIAPQRHAEIVLPMIDRLFNKMGIDKNSLDGIVLGVGPGSFTGVRIAASTAQGLSLGLNLKVAMVTSLEALCNEALENFGKATDYVISSIDARMGEVYIAVYDCRTGVPVLLDEERVLKPEDALKHISRFVDTQNVIACGSGIEPLVKAGLNSSYGHYADFPKAQYIIRKGQKLFEMGKAVDPEFALPLYVRNEVTWKKVNEQ